MSQRHLVNFENLDTALVDICRHLKREHPENCKEIITELGHMIIKYSLAHKFTNRYQVINDLDYSENELLEFATKIEQETEEMLRWL